MATPLYLYGPTPSAAAAQQIPVAQFYTQQANQNEQARVNAVLNSMRAQEAQDIRDQAARERDIQRSIQFSAYRQGLRTEAADRAENMRRFNIEQAERGKAATEATRQFDARILYGLHGDVAEQKAFEQQQQADLENEGQTFAVSYEAARRARQQSEAQLNALSAAVDAARAALGQETIKPPKEQNKQLIAQHTQAMKQAQTKLTAAERAIGRAEGAVDSLIANLRVKGYEVDDAGNMLVHRQSKRAWRFGAPPAAATPKAATPPATRTFTNLSQADRPSTAFDRTELDAALAARNPERESISRWSGRWSGGLPVEEVERGKALDKALTQFNQRFGATTAQPQTSTAPAITPRTSPPVAAQRDWVNQPPTTQEEYNSIKPGEVFLDPYSNPPVIARKR